MIKILRAGRIQVRILRYIGLTATLAFFSTPAASMPLQQAAGTARPAVAVTPVAATQVSDVAARLRQNGATSCSAQINAAGAAALTGATQYDSLSNWNPKGDGKRSVNVAVAQRYPSGEPIPSGVSAIIATPVAPGRCDTVAVQVVPSPLPCDAVRNAMDSRAQLRGQLVGVSVVQQGPTETLLLPTGTNTCVVIDLTTTYAP